MELTFGLTAAFRIFFSVSFSQRRTLQIWWLLSFLQGAQSPQLSFRWQPPHSPHLFLFFFDPFSCWYGRKENSINSFGLTDQAKLVKLPISHLSGTCAAFKPKLCLYCDFGFTWPPGEEPVAGDLNPGAEADACPEADPLPPPVNPDCA